MLNIIISDSNRWCINFCQVRVNSPIRSWEQNFNYRESIGQRLDYCTATSTVYTVQYVQDDNNIIGDNNITISDVATMTTTIYESNAILVITKIAPAIYNKAPSTGNNSSTTVTMTTQIYLSSSSSSSILWLNLRCDNYSAFFVIIFLSPIGAVGRDTDFHLIDQGKVGYLYHLQILLFFILQDASPSENVLSSSSTLLLNLIRYNSLDTIIL